MALTQVLQTWLHRARGGVPLMLYDTMSRSARRFELAKGAKRVRVYSCGPTVYGRQHIGNLSMFVFTDVLHRTLLYNGFDVRHAINITDFGHLSSDADEGEDKMTAGLKREGLDLTLENMRALGEKYANLFFEDLRLLSIPLEDLQFPRASDYIHAEVAMVATLEEKGYAYRGARGVYFDTSRFREYGRLGAIDISALREGARVAPDPDKRHPSDFLLWKSDPSLGWDSPWGTGFPGWHIECSAMIRATLGQQIDIHTGGIEHIAVHHNNEIAQSECATGKKPLARFWMHRAHLQLEGAKIAKSIGNVVYLSDIVERGIHPIALRYLLLGAHYRSPSSFTWEALSAAESAYSKLLALRLSLQGAPAVPSPRWHYAFWERINDDLDTPGALAVLWDMAKDSSLSERTRLATLLDMDRVLGLGLAEPDDTAKKLAGARHREYVDRDDAPEHVASLFDQRQHARGSKDWARADELRTIIEGQGFGIEDAASGSRLYRL